MLFIIGLILSFQNVFAWGPKGQEITVIIAEKLLTQEAKTKLEPVLRGKSLASLATWADQARNERDWKNTGTWHYIDVDDAGALPSGKSNEPGDVRAAIAYAVANFKSNVSADQKLIWLKFIVHLVGDIHQPMHVGRPQDRGGNSTRVNYGKEMNLHFLWDSAFIEKSGLNPQSYASKLVSESRSQNALRTPFQVEAVIKECFELRPFLYSFSNDRIDATYEKKAMTIVDDRLWMGGLRLASLLNQITL